jgi:glycine oxidase
MKIGIAGAGLVGRLMAWRLLREDHSVTVFDRDEVAGEASAARVAAAMLAPYSELLNSERAIFDWGLQSLAQWPGLLQDLAVDSGRLVDFQRRGSVVVAHSRDRELLQQFNVSLRARLSDDNLLQQVQLLDAAQLGDLEPGLATTFERAVFLAAEGCLDNWGLLDALAMAIKSLDGCWLTAQTVSQVIPGRLVANAQQHHFDAVVDARGLGAVPQVPRLRGVRGEILWVRAPEVSLSRPVRLMHPRYQLYIAPKPGDLYVVGATQIESDSLAPITVRSSLELLSALYSVHTGFAEANVVRSYANCRPAYPDNMPCVEACDGLLRINGLYRHGYLLAPAVIGSALAHWGCAASIAPVMVRSLSHDSFSACG